MRSLRETRRVMGGKRSRDKGKRGELEFAALCRENGFDCRRTAQYCGNTGLAADVDGLPGVHVEVKRTETLRAWDYMTQASHDAADGLVPIVAWRKNHHDWLVIMKADDWFSLYREYYGSVGVEGEEKND